VVGRVEDLRTTRMPFARNAGLLLGRSHRARSVPKYLSTPCTYCYEWLLPSWDQMRTPINGSYHSSNISSPSNKKSNTGRNRYPVIDRRSGSFSYTTSSPDIIRVHGTPGPCYTDSAPESYDRPSPSTRAGPSGSNRGAASAQTNWPFPFDARQRWRKLDSRSGFSSYTTLRQNTTREHSTPGTSHLNSTPESHDRPSPSTRAGLSGSNRGALSAQTTLSHSHRQAPLPQSSSSGSLSVWTSRPLPFDT